MPLTLLPLPPGGDVPRATDVDGAGGQVANDVDAALTHHRWVPIRVDRLALPRGRRQPSPRGRSGVGGGAQPPPAPTLCRASGGSGASGKTISSIVTPSPPASRRSTDALGSDFPASQE